MVVRIDGGIRGGERIGVLLAPPFFPIRVGG